MKRTPLTPRPRVPVLVRATALGTLTLAPLACGDDDGTSTNTSVADSDVHPTAGPCAHDPQSPECGSTGLPSTTTAEATAGSTGTTDATSVADSATDAHPTAGPCAHDPQAPECATTGTDGSSDSGTGTTGTGTGSGTSGSG